MSASVPTAMPARWTACCAALASALAPALTAAQSPASAAPSTETPPVRALVYAQSPARTPTPQLLDLMLRPSGPALSHPWLIAQSCVDEGKVVSLPDERGRRDVRVCTPVSSARPGAAGTYATAPRDAPPSTGPDPFGEAMLFHHGARTLAYFAALGLSPPWPAHKAPLRLVANVRMAAELTGSLGRAAGTALAPWPEALFVADGGDETGLFSSRIPAPGAAIWFGEGVTARFAYDADVIVHEVTHALLAPLLPKARWYVDAQGTSGAHTAIDEGLADYFAAAANGDSTIGEHVSVEAPVWQHRSVDGEARCPDALVGRRRPDSLLLSSALWSVRKQLAPRAAGALDRAVVSALLSLEGATTLSLERLLESIVRKLKVESRTLSRSLRRELGRRGLLPDCARVRALDPAQSLAGQTDSFLAPGTHALATHALVPGVVQLHVRIPAGTRVVRLRFRAGSSEQPALERAARSPFRPVVLAKRGAPLRWTRDGQHDADSAHELPLGAQCTARIEVDGVSVLYAQIANAGEQDGFYDDLSVAFER